MIKNLKIIKHVYLMIWNQRKQKKPTSQQKTNASLILRITSKASLTSRFPCNKPDRTEPATANNEKTSPKTTGEFSKVQRKKL